MAPLYGGRTTWRLFPLAVLATASFQGMWFVGFSLTSASNAALIQKTEVLFTFLVLAVLWRKETYSLRILIGVLVAVMGTVLVVFENGLQPRSGDLVLLLLFALVPFGNYLLKLSRDMVSSYGALSLRLLFAGSLLTAISLTTVGLPKVDLFVAALPYVLLQGLLWYFLQQVLWSELIYQMPVSTALVLTSFAPFLTFIWVYFQSGILPSLLQLAGFVLLVIGTKLILKKYPSDRMLKTQLLEDL